MTKKERFQHYIESPTTGEKQWFFPMEIEIDKDDPYRKDYLSIISTNTETHEKYEIGTSKIGFREFMAVMIPVESKEKHDSLIKDELDRQDEMKLDGRCFISAKIGGLKRCPRQIPNPNYKEGSNESKTIMVKCEECPFRDKKHEHTVVPFSTLQSTDDDGELLDFDPANPIGYNSTEQFDKLVVDFLEYVKANKPKLVDLAELLCQEYVQTEAAGILGKSTSTIGSQTDKIKELLLEFLGM